MQDENHARTVPLQCIKQLSEPYLLLFSANQHAIISLNAELHVH